MAGRRNPGSLEKAAAKIVGEVIESAGELYAIRPAPHEQGGGIRSARTDVADHPITSWLDAVERVRACEG